MSVRSPRRATSPAEMSLDRRDELAARVAATLDDGQPPWAVARRAYDLAEALIAERAWREAVDDPASEEPSELLMFVEAGDPRLDAPPHDPRWEVEPRWSERDRARLTARLAEREHSGPGLASARPEADPSERTGT